MQNLLKEKTQQIEKHLRALKDEITNVAPSVRETIVRNPILSVSAALAAGTALGMLLSRQRGVRTEASPFRPSNRWTTTIADSLDNDMESGDHAEEAARRGVRTEARTTAGAEIVRILAPMVVGWVAQSLRKSNKGDKNPDSDS